ncbi:chemotaxis protein CheW, partial [Burkholderia territorii]
STRLVMARCRVGQLERDRVIGLIVERATQTLRIDRAAFRASGVSTARTRWLGRVANTSDGIVQQVSVADLIDDVARQYLFDGLPGHGGESA